MTFSKHLFFVLSLVVAAVTSHQLNAMEDAMTAMLEKHVASDFQIYQLLSAAAQGNPELYCLLKSYTLLQAMCAIKNMEDVYVLLITY